MQSLTGHFQRYKIISHYYYSEQQMGKLYLHITYSPCSPPEHSFPPQWNWWHPDVRCQLQSAGPASETSPVCRSPAWLPVDIKNETCVWEETHNRHNNIEENIYHGFLEVFAVISSIHLVCSRLVQIVVVIWGHNSQFFLLLRRATIY